jgi:type VI secretion system secreted protein VgrG
VQYRETDFNFIARLLEEEGIFFFFDHEDGKHTMVIADGSQPADPCPVLDQVRFVHEQVSLAEDDVVTWFAKEQEVRPAHHTLTDYNFEKPSLDLAAHATGGDPHKYEIYDYPAGGETRDRTESLARLRQEEEDARRIVFRGHGFVRSFTPGFKFSLTSVGSGVSSTFDGGYVLSTIHHHASEGYGQGEGSDSSYENEFECIDSALRFRPPRHTPRPVIQGVQTAVVVGPAGEEIFVDRHGRVKVQFFWDREGKRDENSSCWLRVSQPWAGKGWGGVSIPRIGQEVIVSFMEGDPDRPIIVGRVYNGEQMPPYAFPAGGVVSGLKSQTHKGAGYNELSMDDTAGKEKFTIHGQYDMNTKIEHDYKLDAGNVIEEQAPTHIMLSCGGSYMLIEPGKITLRAGGNAAIVLDANALMQSAAPSRVFLDGNALVQSSGKSYMLLDANACVQSSGKAVAFLDANFLAQSSGGSVVFLDGNAQMSTKADATVSGANVNGIGSSKVSLSGGGSSGLELAGGGATMSGPKATVSGAGSTEITGAIVKIN